MSCQTLCPNSWVRKQSRRVVSLPGLSDFEASLAAKEERVTDCGPLGPGQGRRLAEPFLAFLSDHPLSSDNHPSSQEGPNTQKLVDVGSGKWE